MSARGLPLAANLASLRSRLPGLAGLLEAAAAGAAASGRRLEIVDTPSGLPSARTPDGRWLHSGRDPAGEAARLAGALDERAGVVLVLGFGLGYLPEALLGRAGTDTPAAAAGPARPAAGDSPARQVIVCEADPAALAEALAVRDLSSLLGDERLGFVVGGDPAAVVAALELSGASRAAIAGLAAAEAAAPRWYAAARAAAGRWNAKGAVNEATLRRFGRLWVRNLAANLGRIAACPGVERLAGLMEGLPSLVLAAGPSLDAVLPHMKEIAQRVVVICVDTALRSLLGAGVEPDFLVVVDPQYWNWRHVAGLSSPRSLLVSESAAWPAVFRFGARRVFLGASFFPLGKRIESFAGRKGSLGAGGSVATSAWDLARLLGSPVAYMAGLDLGYPGGATHARASLFEQRALAEATRLAPAASAQAGALLGPRPFEAPAAGGGAVLTDQRMRLFGWWFESRLQKPGSPATFSLSPRGLAVPGLGLAAAQDLLALPPIRTLINAKLDAAAAMTPPPGAAAEARAGLDALLGELGDIARTAARAARAAAEARGKHEAGRDCRAELEALDEADAAILGNAARDVAGFLLPPAEELAGPRPAELGECLARSEALYRRVAAAAEYNLGRLRDARE